jgi:RHS repeat-associated protein
LANSVELATGRFVFSKQLLSLAGLGSGSWSFDLNYKSNYDIDGILGKNFAYPQYMHLEQLPYTLTDYNSLINIQLVTNDLSRAIFTDNGDGTYSPATGNNARATLTYDAYYDTFSLTASNGTVTTFFGFLEWGAPGQIQDIVDRYGSNQTFVWGVANDIPQLIRVIDAYGRTVIYNYYGAEGGYRLQQIIDFLGRQLNFQYDSDDHLIAVITPSILKAAPGNTYPGGTAYVFEYDVDNADPARRDDLIAIWYPNQTQPYLNIETRAVDVQAVYANATPRYRVAYGQAAGDLDTYGKVIAETLGDPINETGGVATFGYTTCSDDLPSNIIDSSDAGTIVSRTIHTDRNDNVRIYDFNAYWTVSRFEVDLNRSKSSLELDNEDNGGVATPPFVTWTKYDGQNQPLVVVYPEGNSTEYTYDSGIVDAYSPPLNPYIPRVGLLLSESRLPGNSISLPHRSGSGSPTVQTILTKRYFYEPLFNQLCAVIDERGNPITTGGTYFTPQNGGTTPSNTDCSRYATLYTFDYQKDTLDTVSGDVTLQTLLGLNATEIQTVIAYVDSQMTATDGTGGIPTGFPMNLGDINGDGTGNGASSGLPDATHLGNMVRTTYPSVLLVGGTTQTRVELYTVNLRGQVTTVTDPEGNLTVTTRYPENDPEGNGQNVSTTLSTQQYGLIREVHGDANPYDVMSLVGASGDLQAFVPGLITRTNTPGVYQDLVTRYEGSASGSAGCVTCGYDPMGNVLNQTDPRGFTTIYDRNEMGQVYRVTSPAPYDFRVEMSYDANRNVIQVDTEDRQVLYNSSDPTDSNYGTFTPTGSGTTAHVPMIAGPGGLLRPGWFSNLMTYDFLDNKIEDDIDATGSSPANLITTYQYDANQNLIKITKPEGNTVEFDYDERDLLIAQRVGYDAATSQPGAVTIYSYDGNKNLLNVIGPVDHNASESGPGATSLTARIANAFGSGTLLFATGDWVLANTYDGFDRVVTATDAVGGVSNLTYDPTSTVIQRQSQGTAGTSATPTDRTGSGNVTLTNSEMRYDEAMRLYEQQQDVFMTGDGGGYAITHTGGGLAANSTANDHTGTVTLSTGGNSYVLARTVYDRSGRIAATLADNTAQTTYAYDGAGRPILTTDPLSNTVAVQYDGNGNPTQSTRTDVCTITTPTVANEVFVSFTWFDCLNRPVVAGTQGADGNLTANLNLCCPWMGLPSTLYSLVGYDSRGNRTTVTDPKLNVVVSLYDGASRRIETQQEMRQNGDGRNGPAANKTFLTPGGLIRTESTYDGNNRLVALTDDRGAAFIYTYDLLDRLVTRTLADGTVTTRVYDLASCLTGFTDENGTVWAMTYDALLRNITAANTPAAGVIGVGAFGTLGYQYDGLSRGTQYTTTPSSLVQLAYDSLNRVLEDFQANDSLAGIVVRAAWQSLVPTQVIYPNYITTANTYDLLYRRTSVTGAYGATPLDTVGWQYFGQQRMVETNWGSDSLIATQMNNARTHSAVQATVPLPAWGDISSDRLGYDGAGRMITKRYLTGGINGDTGAYTSSTALVGYTTSYDRAGNKLYERHLEAEDRSHLYQPFNSDGSFGVGYDSANRLVQYQRGVLSSATIPYLVNPGASVATPTTLPGANQVKTYGLDGLGNWKTSNFTLVNSDESTTSTAEVRSHNYVNEITSVTDTVGGTPTATPFVYDKNGNLLNDGVRIYQYDVLNRLVQISKVAEGTPVIATYVYDALNRRIQKTINDLGSGMGGLTGDIPAGTTTYLYNGQQIAMARDDEGTWEQAYFWGRYIDELLFFSIPTDTVPTTYRVLSDLLYRSTALVDTSNNVVEAYDTDAYGNTLCYSGPGTDEDWFTDDDVATNNPINTTIFTGRLYDPESQIYYYRARYYAPQLGRFISRDPLGSPTMMGDATTPFGSAELTQGPNLYWYTQDNPVNLVDPMGLEASAAALAGAAAAMQAKCTSCVCPANMDACNKEAAAISAALVTWWNASFGKGGWYQAFQRHLITSQTVGGYFCYDWADTFSKAIDSVPRTIWSYNLREWTCSGSSAPVHYGVRLYITNPKSGATGCEINVDDSFGNGNMVNPGPLPSPTSPWSERTPATFDDVNGKMSL